MCYQLRKTPARFPNCKGKSQGNCILFEPEEDYVEWCGPARERGSQCSSLTGTSQGAATKRHLNCRKHRDGSNPNPGPDRDGTDEGSGPGGDGGSGTAGSASGNGNGGSMITVGA
ncbi:hypothetical protein FQN55_001411 [Onygenales sp. PD_40]|nr:hypothetical protein FQN55_001411 [Onygenales sp. PD_40]KAK2785260.1 hypothetical protein FQN53_007836 [Emmonsiellopsis sp. PD_33]